MVSKRRQREYIGYRVYNTQRALHKSLEACVAAAGLTPGQWNLLSQLEEHGAMTQKQLAERLRKEQATVTRSIERLVQRGLVVRTPNPQDRRANIVEATPEASRLLAELEPAVARRNSELAEHISDEDLSVFFDVLDQIDANAARSLEEQ
ncbi:MAG: MarR family transcriptional regulator [Adlercreutzia sp.]|uniref:MarR family winged helix-turn-helix transcriptional regulator n=1 Tax=uncultured Adlercreutzia sp. TaxID=875803 RepID=UPI0021730818|nr:MarR family transcriptional regulator [uncultured Adlercreutzia sp.]MCI8425467.1 MarR family transcriptional regulator [Adlercreutzia sp.]